MGISGGELIVLLLVTFLLIGPERLPAVAQQLGRLTRELKTLATGAKERVKDELGPEYEDLAAFDPRQYDPRRIVREALLDDPPVRPAARPAAARRRAPARAATAAASGGAAGAGVVPPAAGVVPPAAAQEPVTAPSDATRQAAAATAGSAPGARAAVPAPVAPGAATQADADRYVVPFDDEAT